MTLPVRPPVLSEAPALMNGGPSAAEIMRQQGD